jgi:hypothetical protein
MQFFSSAVGEHHESQATIRQNGDNSSRVKKETAVPSAHNWKTLLRRTANACIPSMPVTIPVGRDQLIAVPVARAGQPHRDKRHTVYI